MFTLPTTLLFLASTLPLPVLTSSSGSETPYLIINTWPFTRPCLTAYLNLTSSFHTSGREAAISAVVAGCSHAEALQCDHTVGHGGSPDSRGETTLDALVMSGDATRQMGAVAGLRDVREATSVARDVMRFTKHSVLVGGLATEFAVRLGYAVDKRLESGWSRRVHREWIEKGCRPDFWTEEAPVDIRRCDGNSEEEEGEGEEEERGMWDGCEEEEECQWCTAVSGSIDDDVGGVDRENLRKDSPVQFTGTHDEADAAGMEIPFGHDRMTVVDSGLDRHQHRFNGLADHGHASRHSFHTSHSHPSNPLGSDSHPDRSHPDPPPSTPPSSNPHPSTIEHHDTISQIALHPAGHLAIALSSNGARHHLPGRVGDAPLPGAGGYVDDKIGACVATGDGDVMMRGLPSFLAVEMMRDPDPVGDGDGDGLGGSDIGLDESDISGLDESVISQSDDDKSRSDSTRSHVNRTKTKRPAGTGMSPTQAAEHAIRRVLAMDPGVGGAVVCVNRHGDHGAASVGFDKFGYSVLDSRVIGREGKSRRDKEGHEGKKTQGRHDENGVNANRKPTLDDVQVFYVKPVSPPTEEQRRRMLGHWGVA